MVNNIEVAHFSELTEHNSKTSAVLSPNGYGVASAVQSQLQVWNVNSKEISHRFENDSLIDFIKWSPDSDLICCGTLKECIQVWNLKLPHWRCKITGYLGFVNILWTPDSRYLLIISEFYLKVIVFSLMSSEVTEIDYPKAIENGIVFSPCERYLVIAQRVNFEDFLSVYSCDTLEAIKTFSIETKDLASVSFAPSDLTIAVLESALECKILFYSIDGRLLGKYVSEANFGLISLSWSSVKNLVCFGDCFGKVKVLDAFNFEALASYQHTDTVETSDVIVYKAVENSELKNCPGSPLSGFFELDEVIKCRPVSFTPSVLDSEKGKIKNPLKCGVQTLQFCSNGKYIASIIGNMPKAVFIYDVEYFKLSHVIIRGSTVKSICWHPEKSYLAICSSSNLFDIWTPQSCIRYVSPTTKDFPVCHATWSSKGDCILLNSHDQFSVVYFL